MLSQGNAVSMVCNNIGVTDQTYYRWRKEYGGMRVDQACRLKELEQENSRLKRVVADFAPDNAILKGSRTGKLLSPSKRRKIIQQVCQKLAVSERRACEVLDQTQSLLGSRTMLAFETRAARKTLAEFAVE